jgi:hypothetical protein
VIDGTPQDDFEMSVETRECQMVRFWESVGEGDIIPYCTFFDFTAAESLGVGLKQVSTIDSGVCKYCFYRNGGVEWPEKIRELAEKGVIKAVIDQLFPLEKIREAHACVESGRKKGNVAIRVQPV